MPRVVTKPAIPLFVPAKTFHALDRTVTMMGSNNIKIFLKFSLYLLVRFPVSGSTQRREYNCGAAWKKK
jgi:hypothetical protein